jgi:hypothetical protein
MQTSLHPPQAGRVHGGTHFILLVEPMFVLVCLASLPGTPRRAFDAAGLVLAWFGVFQFFKEQRKALDRILCLEYSHIFGFTVDSHANIRP